MLHTPKEMDPGGSEYGWFLEVLENKINVGGLKGLNNRMV